MRIIILLFLALPVFLQQTFARDFTDYSQSYTIKIKGTVAGHEKVVEKLNDAGQLVSTSEHEMIVSDGLVAKSMAFSTKMVFSKDGRNPVSYTYSYVGGTGDSYEVTIKEGQINRVLHRGGRTSEITVPFQPSMVILDFNVYHQYDYLISKYDNKKGGKQSFADFVPLIGSDIPINLTFLGNSTFECNTGALSVREYRIEFAAIGAGQISVDKDGRLVRLQIPVQDLEVLRDDLISK
jgi:hypothetical protein